MQHDVINKTKLLIVEKIIVKLIIKIKILYYNTSTNFSVR